MKVMERMGLIDKIGRELQSRMTYAEIDVYLRHHSVDTKRPTSGANSKWVYVKELLGDESEAKIISIADDLDIAHHHLVAGASTVKEPKYWTPFHFRLFLSHLSSFKKRTGQLQSALRKFGISAFVAHVDIEPTREWLSEIEAGLHSMDALAAILMPGFKESNWTDQEVGFAVARGVLVIPVIRELDPYGFISRFQGLQAKGKTVAQVAEEIFQILVASERTRTKMLTCLTDTIIHSAQQEEAVERIDALASLTNVPLDQLERVRVAMGASAVLSAGEARTALVGLLSKYKLKPPVVVDQAASIDEDIPF
jgi:hypothetical protein